jgi:hypothetical protein
MNSNFSVKIEQLSTQLNNEQLQDVMGGVWMPKQDFPTPDFPTRYPFPGGGTGPFNPTPTFPRPWVF